ncbi:hypothetical protein [uncultured Kordia sp.]|uniref:hypothetical protein n=1 Tax=uncultured Kordia sp. TaxID=507699 RepID=UPI002609F542|nr:hypothetical protein [uncultured Kordia sp.]
MKKKALKKNNFQKTMISSLSKITKAEEILGGLEARGTSPKCAYSEWETCPGSQV